MGILHHVFFTYCRIKNLHLKKEKFCEKFGLYNESNKLKKKIVGKEVWWFNCASAGEVNATKKLLAAIDRSDRFIIVTTSTDSGLKTFSEYKHPSDNIIGLYVPYDTPQAITNFLNFWSPTNIVLVESEIWPNLILKGSKVARVSIINGRLSPRSFKRWSRFSSLLKYILMHVSFIAASSKSDFENYRQFHNKTFLTGNLKYDADLLPVNTTSLREIEQSIGSRKVFVCASTHSGEEEIILASYKKMLEVIPDLLLIIAPRHIERRDELCQLCFQYKLTAISRNKDGLIFNHIPPETNVYIMNTMGELGIAFSLGKIVFLGGSLVAVGGHNIYEPAMFGCTVITGEKTYNFTDSVNGLLSVNGLIVVSDGDQLLEVVLDLFADEKKAATIAKNGIEFLKSNSGALAKTLKLIMS
jgi:3-deoxy-D-manno-octulosonic-acid transferase